MTKITITKYTKATEEVEVTFPVYIRDLRSYKDGEQYNEFIVLHEDGRSVSVTEDVSKDGKTTYHIDSSGGDISRLVGYCHDDRRRDDDDLKLGEGYAFSTADEFAAKLGAALIAVNRITSQS
jgi:hypothetical protein